MTSRTRKRVLSPPVWREVELVIFDCDGVLVDSDEQALRDAGATEILHSLHQLPRLLDLD